MHTMYTTAVARQIVNDRIKEADTFRLARLVRGGRKNKQDGAAGTGTTERVVRRTERRPALFRSDIIGAH